MKLKEHNPSTSCITNEGDDKLIKYIVWISE